MIDFKKNHAYHCKTEKIATALLREAHEQGYKWKNGETYPTSDNKWDEYKEDTCYNIVDGYYQHKYGYSIDPEFTIVDATSLVSYELSLEHEKWLKMLLREYILPEGLIETIGDVLVNGRYTESRSIILNQTRLNWINGYMGKK
jgi:hypothetical protein